MIPLIMCYVSHSVELLGPTTPQFSNPDPRAPQISNQIDAPALVGSFENRKPTLGSLAISLIPSRAGQNLGFLRLNFLKAFCFF